MSKSVNGLPEMLKDPSWKFYLERINPQGQSDTEILLELKRGINQYAYVELERAFKPICAIPFKCIEATKLRHE